MIVLLLIVIAGFLWWIASSQSRQANVTAAVAAASPTVTIAPYLPVLRDFAADYASSVFVPVASEPPSSRATLDKVKALAEARWGRDTGGAGLSFALTWRHTCTASDADGTPETPAHGLIRFVVYLCVLTFCVRKGVELTTQGDRQSAIEAVLAVFVATVQEAETKKAGLDELAALSAAPPAPQHKPAPATRPETTREPTLDERLDRVAAERRARAQETSAPAAPASVFRIFEQNGWRWYQSVIGELVDACRQDAGGRLPDGMEMPEWRDWIVLVSEPYVEAVDDGPRDKDLRQTLIFAAYLAHKDPTPYKGSSWTNEEIAGGATILTVVAPDSKHVIVGLEPEMDQFRKAG